MKNLIGLAFTADAITIAHFKISPDEQILNSLDQISYPFNYNESNFFQEDNIVRLANHILNHLESKQVQPSSVSISIESNLCLAKRIKIPLNMVGKDEAAHIHWDLENSTITPLEEYVYLKTDSVFNRNGFKEVFVIALRKSIVDFFQKLVGITKLTLTNLSSNHLAAEICLKHASDKYIDGINLLFRISQQRLESICLYNGNVFMSNYEKIKMNSVSSVNEILFEKIADYLKFAENYFGQIDGAASTINQAYLYGSEITEELMSLLNRNISVPISVLNPINKLNYSPEVNKLVGNTNNLAGFVECIGVALDAD